MKQLIASIGIALLATTLSACGTGQTGNASAPVASTGPIAAAIDQGLDQAETKLTTQNINLDDHDSSLPKAEITPAGDLLIAGKPVALNPAQRQQVLAYRQQVIAIGQEGIAVGRQGAALGVHAAGAALAAVFAGKSQEQVRQQVEAQASGVRAAAMKICNQLPALRASQQQLAAAVPEFKPYATLRNNEITECRNDTLHVDDTDQSQVQQDVRNRIRSGIRSGIQSAAQGAGMASSGTPAPATSTSAANSRPH